MYVYGLFVRLQHAISEHGAEVRRASGQHHTVSTELLTSHGQDDVTQLSLLPQFTHHLKIKDGVP